MAFPLCGNSRLSLMKNPHSPPHLGTRLARPYQSVKSLPVRIFTIGKKRAKGTQLLVEEYMEKLKSYCSVDDIQLKSNPKHTSDVKAQIDGEDLKIMHHIRSDDWVVVLDENGLDIGSEQMAEIVGEAANTIERHPNLWYRNWLKLADLNRISGKLIQFIGRCIAELLRPLIHWIHSLGSSTLVFCIGGPYGHGEKLRKRADITIRLSSMVLNHQIALIVLLEQIYRAWTILKGQKYHH